MSEGLNLQGASAIVHLDLPTTLRIAEQRVGRVDRMDSPYDVIEAWWPDDSDAFATSVNELLTARSEESAALLGSNLAIPELLNSRRRAAARPRSGDAPVDVHEVAEAVENLQAHTWEGIHDALDPVRELVEHIGGEVGDRIMEQSDDDCVHTSQDAPVQVLSLACAAPISVECRPRETGAPSPRRPPMPLMAVSRSRPATDGRTRARAQVLVRTGRTSVKVRRDAGRLVIGRPSWLGRRCCSRQ